MKIHLAPFAIIAALLLGMSLSSQPIQAGKPARSHENTNDTKTILFFGNSLTAGYGLDPSQAFPALIQNKLDSIGWDFEAVNGGLSGETSAGGLRRISWMLRRKVDVFVLELGGNDALRGVDLASTRQNLQSIIDKVKKAYPESQIVIAGMQVPPNLGPQYVSEFRDMYVELAKKNEATLIPFLLEGVGGIERLNLADRIHPNSEGHKIIAETVWGVLRPLIDPLQNE